MWLLCWENINQDNLGQAAGEGQSSQWSGFWVVIFLLVSASLISPLIGWQHQHHSQGNALCVYEAHGGRTQQNNQIRIIIVLTLLMVSNRNLSRIQDTTFFLNEFRMMTYTLQHLILCPGIVSIENKGENELWMGDKWINVELICDEERRRNSNVWISVSSHHRETWTVILCRWWYFIQVLFCSRNAEPACFRSVSTSSEISNTFPFIKQILI